MALLDDNALGSATEKDRWLDHVSIAAGSGRVVGNERVTSRLKLPTLWLHRERLNRGECPSAPSAESPGQRKTFMTSSPRWLMTLTAIRLDWGLANDREVSLWHSSSYITFPTIYHWKFF